MAAAKKKGTSPASVTDPVVSKLGRLGANAPGRASHAYVIIPAEDGPLTFAVELADVSFKGARILEPSGSPETRGFSMERIHSAIAERTFNDSLGWYSKYSTGGGR